MKILIPTIMFICLSSRVNSQPEIPQIQWEFKSTEKGDMEVPNGSDQQTSCAVFDIDKDGINDFIITERVKAPSVVWYKKNGEKWDRYILDSDQLKIEAGNAFYDIDNDGDLDPVFGGEYNSNQIWWWENPYPYYDPVIPWVRHTIKKSGLGKHHDQIIADFDGDGLSELVFWNQLMNALYIADIPDNPRELEEWDFKMIYQYSSDSEMQQRGEVPEWKGINEHEGLAKADIDMDGVLDIVGGARWFKHLGNHEFQENIVDASYAFSRCASGQLIEGGRPEIILVVGDGTGPMIMYEWQQGTWKPKTLIDMVDNGHSLSLLDFNGDGHLDIFNAEMRFSESHNPKAKLRILLGDGKGNFTDWIINEGYSNHESKIADLDGDGDYDILSKPYAYRAPGIDIWLQNGTGKPLSAIKAVNFNKPVGLQLYSLRYAFKEDIPGTLKKVSELGIHQVEVSDYYGYQPKEFKKLLKQNNMYVPSMIFGWERFKNDMENLVIFEMDAMWVSYAGCDPVWLMKKYGDRIKLIHLKDLRWGTGPVHTGRATDPTASITEMVVSIKISTTAIEKIYKN
jgi:hypothetical protein